MKSGTYLALAVWLLICLADLHKHNKNVDKLFADPDPNLPDGKHSRMRNELHIELYGFYLLLIALLVLFVLNLISDLSH